MNFGKIIETLYSDNEDDIINLINKSIYVEQYAQPKENLVFHTGFTFRNHLNKKFELLYDLTADILINQVRLPGYSLPQLCGVNVKYEKTDIYFKKFLPVAMYIFIGDSNFGFAGIENAYNISNTDNVKEYDGRIEYTSGEHSIERIKSFSVVDNDENEEKYPLSKNYLVQLFFNGNVYSKNQDFDFDDDDF